MSGRWLGGVEGSLAAGAGFWVGMELERTAPPEAAGPLEVDGRGAASEEPRTTEIARTRKGRTTIGRRDAGARIERSIDAAIGVSGAGMRSSAAASGGASPMRSKGTCNGDLRFRPLQVPLVGKRLGSDDGFDARTGGLVRGRRRGCSGGGLGVGVGVGVGAGVGVELGSELERRR